MEHSMMLNITSKIRALHWDYFPILDDIATAEVILILLFNVLLLVLLLAAGNLRKQHSVKFFINLQAVHILLALLLLVRLAQNTEDVVFVYLSNGLLMEMFLCLQVCTLDRFIAIKYPYR